MRLFQVSLKGKVWPNQLLVEAEDIADVPGIVREKVQAIGRVEFRLIRFVGHHDSLLKQKKAPAVEGEGLPAVPDQVVHTDQPQVGQETQPS
jgi:hypothetical protein